MAVDSLKRTGTSIDLYTYNSGPESASLNSILGKSEMKDMDIIFGPLYQQHIKPLAEFAKKQDTRLVIPFTSKDNTVFQNPAVYQINTPQSYLYSEVYDHFVRQFPNANVIFIEASQGTKDKAEFIKGLKDELRNRSIPMKSLKEDVTVESLKTVLRTDRENIFIPTSGSNLTLIKILPQLTLLVREQPESRIHLFGYPEWQTYTKDHLEAFFELDTYFYSSFIPTICCLPPSTLPKLPQMVWQGDGRALSQIRNVGLRYRLFLPERTCALWLFLREEHAGTGPGAHPDRLQVPTGKQLGRLHQQEGVLRALHQEL